MPLFVIHGGKDSAVPLGEGQLLYELASEPKEWLEVPSGNHLMTSSKDMKKVLNAVDSWIAADGFEIDLKRTGAYGCCTHDESKIVL